MILVNVSWGLLFFVVSISAHIRTKCCAEWNAPGVCVGAALCTLSEQPWPLGLTGQFPGSMGTGKLKMRGTEAALLGTDRRSLHKVPESIKPLPFLFLAWR